MASCASTLFGYNEDYQIPSDSDFTVNDENWELKAYVDEFRLPTDNKYIETTAIVGIFSNSATTGSECTAQLRINYKGLVEIVIYEYGQYRADAYSSERYTYNVTEVGNRDVVLSKGYATLTDRFSIEGESAVEVINTLCKGGSYIFSLAGGKYTTSIYVVTFDGTGCAAALSKLFPIASNVAE